MQEPHAQPLDAEPIVFPGLLVIVGGGRLDVGLLRQLRSGGAALVGADGGADAIADAGFVPEAIIGDMDSLDDIESWADVTQVLRIAEQDTTDFEKALYSTRAPVSVALGMTGKRLDHTLAALDAVARYSKGRHIVLVDESDIALAVSGAFAFSVEAGARISIHPLVPVRFETSNGLVYPLDGLVLAPGVRTGTSNKATEGAFSIEPAAGEEGAWLLILERGYLAALLEHLERCKA